MKIVLSREAIDKESKEAQVACPLNINGISLQTGKYLNGDLDVIATYLVKVEGDVVYVGFSE